jgi:hypothetical protein
VVLSLHPSLKAEHPSGIVTEEQSDGELHWNIPGQFLLACPSAKRIKNGLVYMFGRWVLHPDVYDSIAFYHDVLRLIPL